ncbi:divisome protein SepX/GlpR [Tsukamurella serpentis]
MIPQTLLWVGLIVAWLVVLVPMLAARHPKVNQVSDATLKTRLLHRGGSAKLALRRKIRPTGQSAERDEPAESESGTALEAERAAELTEDDEVLFTSRADDPAEQADEEAEAHAFVDSDVDDLHAVSPMDGETTPIRTVRRADMTVPVESAEPDESAEPVESVEPVRRAEPAELEVRPADAADLPSETSDEVADESSELADEVDEVDEASGEIPADEALTEEVTPVDRAAVERIDGTRSRRGGFDPENDARITEARFRFRQRVTLVLGVLAVVALGAGLMNVPFAWYGLGAVVLALALYLTYLRRTVRIEAEIRRRRTARLERARRERAREAEEFDGVPAHRRRGGCIVMEIDDEDPAFDHLPRYRAEEFEFLHRPELREPMERKVG